MSNVPPWLDTMRSITGVVEAPGDADNPIILDWARAIGKRYPEMASYCAGYTHDEVPWCGLTVAYCMAANGIRPPYIPDDDLKSFLWVDAWRKWGAAVEEGQELPGDVLVFAPSPHHVALFESRDGDYYVARGGNQGNAVTQMRISVGAVAAIRRPPAISQLPVVSTPTPNSNGQWSSGRGSWYSWYDGKYSWEDHGDAPNSNALGVPDDEQGCAFYTRSTLGDWFDVKAPNGVVLTLQHTDVGPHPKTGRSIDIAAVAAEKFGYTPSNFPTDGVFLWRKRSGPPKEDEVAQVPTVQDPNVSAALSAILELLRKQQEAQAKKEDNKDQSATSKLDLGVKPGWKMLSGIAGILATWMAGDAGIVATDGTLWGVLLTVFGALGSVGFASKLDRGIKTLTQIRDVLSVLSKVVQANSQLGDTNGTVR